MLDKSIYTLRISQVMFCLKGNPYYNAYEKDIAVVNLYFGDSTVFGDLLNVVLIFFLIFPKRLMNNDLFV